MVWLETKRGDWVNLNNAVSLDRLFLESELSQGRKTWHVLLQLDKFKVIIEGGIDKEEDAKEIQDKIMNRVRSGVGVIYRMDYYNNGTIQ